MKYLSFIAWQFGGLGWVTVNTDDNVNSHGGGYASVFRNHFGRWLGGFTLALGRCDPLEAELWEIYNALRLAWKRGWKKIELQYDCAAAVALVQGQGKELSELLIY